MDPERRLPADQRETGFTVQAVMALQGTAEEQLRYTTSDSI